MRQRDTNWSSEEGNPNTNKPQKLPEPLQPDQSQETLTNDIQSKHMN